MRRRDFLSGVKLTAAGVPILVATEGKAGSIYGEPNSTLGPDDERIRLDENRLFLSLSRGNVPTEIWSDIGAFADVWWRLFNDQDQARKFARDPDGYLRKVGIPSSVLNSRTVEVKVMRACLDEELLRVTAESGSYVEFVSRLQQMGVVDSSEDSGLKEKLVQAFEDQRDALEQAMRDIGIDDEEQISSVLAEDDLNAIARMAEEGKVIAPGSTVSAAATIAIIAIGIIVVVVAGAAVAAAAVILVFALALVLIIAALSQVVRVVVFGGSMSQMGATPMNPRLAMLSPELIEDAEIKMQVAEMLGGEHYSREAYRDVLRSENRAFLGACEDLGILFVDDTVRDEFLDRVDSAVFSFAGV